MIDQVLMIHLGIPLLSLLHMMEEVCCVNRIQYKAVVYNISVVSSLPVFCHVFQLPTG